MRMDHDPTANTAGMLYDLTCRMLKGKQIDKSLADYLDPYNGQMRTPRGTFCRAIDGVRLLVSTGESFRAHRFLLTSDSKIQPTYLKDTGDTIRKIENLHLPDDIILASLDVVSMFTSVPQDQAFRTTLETLTNLDPCAYDPPVPGMKYMSELLQLVLYRNSFEFNNEHFLQISGVPMGQRSLGSICNLVIHELEKEILRSTEHIHTL